MKKIIFIVFLFVAIEANAQQYIPFPTDSAQWSVRHYYNNSQSCNSYQYKMKGDTILNGIIYHKIYYSHDLAYSSPNQTLHCFVREDSTKKVFVKYPSGAGVDTAEFMLYNFNLSIGDTVTIKLLYFTTDSTYKLQVTAIDSFATNIDTRRYYRLTTIPPAYWPCAYFQFDWRVGAGSPLSPFYDEIPDGCATQYEVSCFWYKGVYIWGGTYCDYETGIDEIKTNDNNLQVYPTPANVGITVEFNLTETTNVSIEIKNALGQIVKVIDNRAFSNGKNKIEIDVNEFSSGVYFVQLQSVNKIFNAKFVKQ